MQTEGTKQTFIMNYSVLDYSNLPPECLKLHRFSEGHDPGCPTKISFFFMSNSSLCFTSALAQRDLEKVCVEGGGWEECQQANANASQTETERGRWVPDRLRFNLSKAYFLCGLVCTCIYS